MKTFKLSHLSFLMCQNIRKILLFGAVVLLAAIVIARIIIIDGRKQATNIYKERLWNRYNTLLAENIFRLADSKKLSPINDDWLSDVYEIIKKQEYDITWQPNTNNYQSPNRANNLRFIYYKNGFSVSPRAKTVPIGEGRGHYSQNILCVNESNEKNNPSEDWKLEIRVAGIKTSDGLISFYGEKLNVERNKAFIEDQNLRIEYNNDENGMRQNFIVKQKPEKAGNDLILKMNTITNLHTVVKNEEILFRNSVSEEKMRYNSLMVWDAKGKLLSASFRDERVNEFSIVVNTQDATYPITIDPLSTTANWSGESNQLTAYFGFSATTAGDVNGDGFGDVIVGAYSYNNGETDEGKTYAFYGSSGGLNTTADWTAEGNQASAYFGYSVSTAEDVNGDGYSDVIVGSYQYDNGQTDEGRAYVYHGSSGGLNTTADWITESNLANANFGKSVSTAGDVNGDGYSDVIVGAFRFANGQASEGRAFVFHGSSGGLNITAAWTAESNQTNALFGMWVCTAGDVNGDGYSDVIVGASDYDNGEFDEGRAFVYHGSAGGLNTTADWTAESNQASAYFGSVVSTAGDVNGDGYSDVIIGAYYYDNGESNEGKAFVYHGSSGGLNTTASWTVESNQASAYLGRAVSAAGDVNGDGYSDVIVGADSYDNGETNEGIVYVFYGSSVGLSTTADWTAEINQASASFGRSVSTAGDVNGDGYSDVIVGAHFYDNSHTNEGGAFVYHGSPGGLSTTANWSAESNQVNGYLGISVSTAGDVNGDGFNDVIVGAYGYDNGEVDEGRAYVFHGSLGGLNTTANWTAEGNQAYANFGTSVSFAGDVNGDGYGDVIVGADGYDNGETNEGKAFVYHGSSTGLNTTAAWSVEGNQAFALLGSAVSSAGDVNGDGFSDVILGLQYYDNPETNEGRAFVYYGSSSGLNTTADWTAESNQANAYFGISVSTAGDVNGDGFSDVIIGARYYDNGETDEGRAFVYHGSSTGLSTVANWTAESNQNYGSYGFSVSTAGDVNGDGYSDVIVGATYYDNGETNEGRAFVYHGSTTGLSTVANWSSESNQANSYFGYSVSNAGDVSGDGYGDVIVSIPYYDNDQTDEGKANLYYGSSSGLNTTADWTVESNQATAYFGISLSAAGDVNGDGFSDVIVGAWGYDDTESNEGKSFVYYGNSGGGLRGTVQQYIPSTTTVIGPNGKTSINGQVKLAAFGKSHFGRADGKLVWEYKATGQSFGSITSSSGEGSFSDLGTIITGVELTSNITGISTGSSYRWRARIKYNQANNPYQVYSP